MFYYNINKVYRFHPSLLIKCLNFICLVLNFREPHTKKEKPLRAWFINRESWLVKLNFNPLEFVYCCSFQTHSVFCFYFFINTLKSKIFHMLYFQTHRVVRSSKLSLPPCSLFFIHTFFIANFCLNSDFFIILIWILKLQGYKGEDWARARTNSQKEQR